MKYLLIITTILLSKVCYSQQFYNRTLGTTTPNDPFLSSSRAFYMPRSLDTTLNGGLDSIGALTYDRIRRKIWIRDSVLLGGHKWTQIFKQDDTATTLATRYDLTQLSFTNNNIGSGYRWAVPNTNNIKTVFDSNTILWDSTSNLNGLTAKADTSVLATQYDLTLIGLPSSPINSIQFNNSGSFGGDAGLTYNATSNTVTTDSAHAIQHRADFVTLNQIDIIDSLRAFGNSIEFGSSASPISLSYVNRLGSYLEKPVGNYAISSRGMVTTVSQAYIYTPAMNNAITITKIGFNDIRRADIFGVNGYKTTNKIINGHNCLFAAHFLKSFVGAGSASVTRYNVGGSWSAPWDARAEAGKSATGAFTGGNNDSATYVFTDSTVIVGLIGGNTEGSTYEIYVDNVLKKTGTTIGQYDGVNDGFTGNTRAPLCAIITGLTYAQHTCKVVKTSGASLLILDYFGHLVDAASAPPLVFLHLPYMDATGYATSPANSSNIKTDTINNKIDSIVASFNPAYPVFRVQTNTCYDTLTGLNLSDHIHPNNTGHLQIFNCISAALSSDSKPLASLYFSDSKLYFIDSTGPNKVILGGGTSNYIPKFSTENKIGISQIQDDGTNVGINQTPATYKLSVAGSLRSTTDAYFATSSGSVGIGTTAPNQKLDVNGHISLTGTLFSKGTLSGINIDSRQSSTSAWALYADNNALKFFSIANTLDRIKFWARGGMAIGYAAEANISDLGSTLDVHGSVRITPDSVQQVSSVTSEKVALLDTITGKIKSIYASTLVPSVTTLYTGDGSLSGDRIVTGAANSLTFTSTRTGTNSTITVNNTSSGRGINVSTSSGIGVRAVGTTGIGLQGVSTDNYGVWSESTNAPGLYVISTASNAADMTVNPTSTNTVVTMLKLIRSSQSAGADGIGQSIDFNINNTAAAGTTVLANQIISKLTTATSTVETSQLQLKGRNAGTATTVATFDGDGTYTTIGRRIIAVTVSAAGTLTLGNSHSYVFSGTTTTWTLPAVSGTTGVIYYIKNRGSGSITLNANAAANEIYSTSAVSTYEITAGSAIILISDGTYWTVN